METIVLLPAPRSGLRVRKGAAMLSGVVAIVVAISVITGIFYTYSNRQELATDVAKLLPFLGMHQLPENL
jgi:hypothetical protein